MQQPQKPQKPQYLPMQPPPNWVPPPFQGPPPIPAGVAINPQQWQAGFWQYNPAYRQQQQQQQQQQQYVPWIPSRHWGQQHQHQSQQHQHQHQHHHQQQQQPSSQSYNPYKRVPRPPSAEYLASQLSDNPLGLSNMIPAEELEQSQTPPEEIHTPWIWNPAELAYDKDESSTPSRPTQLQRSHTDPAISPSEDQEPESFTSKRNLQPTFSPNIIRTPGHYRRDSSITPSPSRSSGFDSQLSSRIAQLSTSPNPLSRQSSAPSALYSSATVNFPQPPQPPMLTDRISEEPASMLSPLVIAAPTPKPNPPSSLRAVRNHHSHPGVIQQPLSTIPEMPSAPSSRDSSVHHPPTASHANTLPNPPKSQGSLTYPAPPPPLLPKVRDSETRAGSRHTTTAFIDPPSPRTPSPRRRIRPPSAHASPVRRSSNDSLKLTPPNKYRDSSPPPMTPASHSHSHRNIFIPPPTPPPASYDIRIRRGYWNRRGDHLTREGYLVYAPADKAYPPELISYPPETEGYQDEKGSYTKYVARPELPESLPRHGKPPEYPYEVFVTYHYM